MDDFDMISMCLKVILLKFLLNSLNILNCNEIHKEIFLFVFLVYFDMGRVNEIVIYCHIKW